MTPSSVERIALKALKVTTKALKALNSKIALTITYLVPGDKDEALRSAVVAFLESFKSELERTSGQERKQVAKHMAIEITMLMDAGKSDPKHYDTWVQNVYQDNKEMFKVA